MGLKQWLKKKIKLEEEAISEILVADTDSESRTETSDVEDYFEEEEEKKEEEEDSKPQHKSPIANTGQRNHQPNCAAVCVLAAKERAQCISAPDVMWACAWCLVLQNMTQK